MQILRTWTRKINAGRLFHLNLPRGRADRDATMNARTGRTVLVQL